MTKDKESVFPHETTERSKNMRATSFPIPASFPALAYDGTISVVSEKCDIFPKKRLICDRGTRTFLAWLAMEWALF